jgi:hypothetical protein
MKQRADQIRIFYSHLVPLCVPYLKACLVFHACAGGELSASCSFDKLTDPAAL